MSKNRVSLTREELYKQVWETPMKKLASKYGISDRGLAKICKRHRIPVPGLGYWARKAAGKRVIQYQLPKPNDDTPHEVLISPTEPKPEVPAAIQLKLDSSPVAIDDITVSERLTSPHPVIKAWMEEHKERRRQVKEEVRNDPFRRNLILPFGTKPFTPIEHRQHRILNVLFKTLQKNGFIIKSERYQQAYLEYEGIKIEFVLREKHKQIRRPPNDDEKKNMYYRDHPWIRELQPTGKLAFSIKTWIEKGLKKEWLEKEDNILEGQLPEIIKTLLVAAPLLVEERKRRQEEQRLYKEEAYRRHLEEEAYKKDEN